MTEKQELNYMDDKTCGVWTRQIGGTMVRKANLWTVWYDALKRRRFDLADE